MLWKILCYFQLCGINFILLFSGSADLTTLLTFHVEFLQQKSILQNSEIDLNLFYKVDYFSPVASHHFQTLANMSWHSKTDLDPIKQQSFAIFNFKTEQGAWILHILPADLFLLACNRNLAMISIMRWRTKKGPTTDCRATYHYMSPHGSLSISNNRDQIGGNNLKS